MVIIYHHVDSLVKNEKQCVIKEKKPQSKEGTIFIPFVTVLPHERKDTTIYRDKK
jgi:hypothetical protein